MKDSKVSHIVLLILAIMVTLNIAHGTQSESNNSDHEKLGFFNADTASMGHVGIHQDTNNIIDIPLPLDNIPEQILYKYSYIVSYNKSINCPVYKIN